MNKTSSIRFTGGRRIRSRTKRRFDILDAHLECRFTEYLLSDIATIPVSASLQFVNKANYPVQIRPIHAVGASRFSNSYQERIQFGGYARKWLPPSSTCFERIAYPSFPPEHPASAQAPSGLADRLKSCRRYLQQRCTVSLHDLDRSRKTFKGFNFEACEVNSL